MRYLMRISYDGSKYNGFQRLKNKETIQGYLENVLSKINGSKVLVKGAGRTDALVHAYDQCVHFDLEKDFDCEKLKYIVNRLLPLSISVNTISKVADDFHARFMVKEKTYLYKIYFGEKDAFLSNYAYHLSYQLDLKLMKEASKEFIGTHDFHNFVSGYRKSYLSTINDFKIYKEGNMVYFEVTGKGFYRYMVRSLVGALIMVGSKKKNIIDIHNALANPDLKSTFLIVPGYGLYLQNIKY